MSKTFQPEIGSLAARVCAFFARERDEKLSAEDIALKFDCDQAAVRQALTDAIDHGWLKCDRRKSDPQYEAGPLLPSENLGGGGGAAAGFQGWLQRRGEASAEGMPKRRARTLPAASSIVIEKGVPLPPPRSQVDTELLARFAEMEPGDSFACSLPASKGLVTLARKWGKPLGRNFVTRQLDAERARIWRLK